LLRPGPCRRRRPAVPTPDFGLNPGEWHAQELLLMREVMRGIGRSLAPALVLREMLHLMSELLGLNRGRIVLADPAPPAQPARAPLPSSMPTA
jgi:Nif-specific regulatory protein